MLVSRDMFIFAPLSLLFSILYCVYEALESGARLCSRKTKIFAHQLVGINSARSLCSRLGRRSRSPELRTRSVSAAPIEPRAPLTCVRSLLLH